jgi:hypothetical protein
LRGNLGLLTRARPISPEDRRAVLADMVSESDRLIRLLNDLLLAPAGTDRRFFRGDVLRASEGAGLGLATGRELFDAKHRLLVCYGRHHPPLGLNKRASV